MVMAPRLALDLLAGIAATPRGATFTLTLAPQADPLTEAALAAWCAAAGHALVDFSFPVARIRRGPAPDPLAGLSPTQHPGTRLWLYTNFDCNLACDYCCTLSSPRALRRALGLDRVRSLAAEAAFVGVRELLLTGGEPFLLPDIDALANHCSSWLPTTLLTNGTLLAGRRLERLRKMNPERLTLQISLDAATAAPHDAHRGDGSWVRAVKGIATAQESGFRVRVAATVAADTDTDLAAFHDFLDGLGIAREDQVIRALARQGFSGEGIEVGVQTVIPEVTVTADGVYWHPVGVTDPGHLVAAGDVTLTAALAEVNRRFGEYRAAADSAAQWFPCA